MNNKIVFYNNNNNIFEINDNQYLFTDYLISKDVPSYFRENSLQSIIDKEIYPESSISELIYEKQQELLEMFKVVVNQLKECLNLFKDNHILHNNITPSNIYLLKDKKGAFKIQLSGFEYASKFQYIDQNGASSNKNIKQRIENDQFEDFFGLNELILYFLKILNKKDEKEIELIEINKDDTINFEKKRSTILYKYCLNTGSIPYYFRVLNIEEFEKALGYQNILQQYLILCLFSKINKDITVPFNTELVNEGKVKEISAVPFNYYHCDKVFFSTNISQLLVEMGVEIKSKIQPNNFKNLIPRSISRLIEFSKSSKERAANKLKHETLSKDLKEVLSKSFYYSWEFNPQPIKDSSSQELLKLFSECNLSLYFSNTHDEFLKYLYFEKMYLFIEAEKKRRSILNEIYNNSKSSGSSGVFQSNNIHIPKHRTQVQREIVENQLENKFSLFENNNSSSNGNVGYNSSKNTNYFENADSIIFKEFQRLSNSFKLEMEIKNEEQDISILKYINEQQQEQQQKNQPQQQKQKQLPNQQKEQHQALENQKNQNCQLVKQLNIEYGTSLKKHQDLKDKIDGQVDKTNKELSDCENTYNNQRDKLLNIEKEIEKINSNPNKRIGMEYMQYVMKDPKYLNNNIFNINNTNNNNKVNINNSNHNCINNNNNNNENEILNDKYYKIRQMTSEDIEKWLSELKYIDEITIKTNFICAKGETLIEMYQDPNSNLFQGLGLTDEIIIKFKESLNELFNKLTVHQ